ncbi:hypothetical protein [Zobellella sp. An-6]|uniref:hypothetical protein n=1 Tax=Zobellella sp. An-6 TaxID=3400218 RepID=UPI004042AB4D
MTPQLWIAVGFTALLIVFLMITFFIKDTSSATQYKTLRFLTSFCGGVAGIFFAGEALISYSKGMADGTKLTLSGTAGFAVFFILWLTYGHRPDDNAPPNIKMSFPAGWTFEQCAKAIGKSQNSPITFSSFSQEQLDFKLPQMDINAEDINQALNQLKHYIDGTFSYTILQNDGVYTIKVIEG